METLEILYGITALILILYYYLTSTFDFWKTRGVCGPRPIPGFGNLKDVTLRKVPLTSYLRKLYNDYQDKPLVGIFASRTPILIIKDPDLIKDVLIKDFSVFADRGYTVHEKSEPLSQNLFHVDSERWRFLRPKLSPSFTSHKLKRMFSLISDCANRLIDYTEKLTSENEPVECLELMAKYATDVIGCCAFGIEMNAMSNEKNEFRRIGKNVFCKPFSDRLRERIKLFSPWFYDILGYIVPDSEITSFFIRLVLDTMNYRNKNNIVKNDFIDMLRELKNNSHDINFTDSMIASQAFIFFAAGFETSSTAMTNTLYELALNQKIQDRLREEIDQYTKYDDLTYENIKKMKYLDKVFKETLRKYPPVSFFSRKSLSSYTFNNTKVSIPKNQIIWLPIFAFQRDPHVYPEPDIFDPERFNEEAVKNRHPMFFQSFGNGPRNCIGSRFAIYQSKLGLIKILQNYKVMPCEKTPIPYVIDEEMFIMSPKNGMYLRIIKIN